MRLRYNKKGEQEDGTQKERISFSSSRVPIFLPLTHEEEGTSVRRSSSRTRGATA